MGWVGWQKTEDKELIGSVSVALEPLVITRE